MTHARRPWQRGSEALLLNETRVPAPCRTWERCQVVPGTGFVEGSAEAMLFLQVMPCLGRSPKAPQLDLAHFFTTVPNARFPQICQQNGSSTLCWTFPPQPPLETGEGSEPGPASVRRPEPLKPIICNYLFASSSPSGARWCLAPSFGS